MAGGRINVSRWEDAAANQGRFEGQPAFVAYCWEKRRRGAQLSADGEWLEIKVTEEERQAFPLLRGCGTVRLRQDSAGCIESEWF